MKTVKKSVKLHISQQSAVENGIEFWTVADEQRFNIALLGVKLLRVNLSPRLLI